MFLSEETSMAMRVLIYITKYRIADIDMLQEAVSRDENNVQHILDTLLKYEIIREDSSLHYKLKTNPNVITLYDVAEIMNDENLHELTNVKHDKKMDELDQLYRAATEMNKNWMKIITVSNLAKTVEYAGN